MVQKVALALGTCYPHLMLLFLSEENLNLTLDFKRDKMRARMLRDQLAEY